MDVLQVSNEKNDNDRNLFVDFELQAIDVFYGQCEQRKVCQNIRDRLSDEEIHKINASPRSMSVPEPVDWCTLKGEGQFDGNQPNEDDAAKNPERNLHSTAREDASVEKDGGHLDQRHGGAVDEHIGVGHLEEWDKI